MTVSSSGLVFVPLSGGLRGRLEGVVVEARGVVEGGVGRVFERLGVTGGGRSSGVPSGLSEFERVLRRVVLAKVRQVGSFGAAVEEVGFGVWHRMLFARFLAENGLLMHPVHGVAVSLAECGELAVEWGEPDGWGVASRFAAEMLPGLFPRDDPLVGLRLLPEDLAALERILEGLPSEVFTSDDGLGWVYQFWQSRRKDEINASEVKIGGRELPAVTQLFTEHYMVRFLLENSLGAWWAARHPGSPLLDSFEYLRFTDEGEPAAGSFEGWPERVAEVTVMDPCCGSGHFLVAAFEMLWRMRVEEEGLDPVEAQDRVIAENLFGLELDPRCTQMAAFNVALAAWKAGGYRELPTPNVACSGIRVAGSLDEWLELAGDDARLRDGLEALHAQFRDADTLGSLINPRRASEVDKLTGVDFDQLEPLLHEALAKETSHDPAAAVFGRQAQGVAHAATLLARQYTLVATNPPFLTGKRQSSRLFRFLDQTLRRSRAELAVAMLDRWLRSALGGAAFVMPENLASLVSYAEIRRAVLLSERIAFLALLGAGAFGEISGEVVRVLLVGLLRGGPEYGDTYFAIDASTGSGLEKAMMLCETNLTRISQLAQLDNPDQRWLLAPLPSHPPLGQWVEAWAGIQTGDYLRFGRCFWEVDMTDRAWERQQSTVSGSHIFDGREHVLFWEGGNGTLERFAEANRERLHDSHRRGSHAWGRQGVVVSQIGDLPVSLYTGELFDNNVAVLVPNDPSDLLAVWCFTRSSDFLRFVRALDRKLNVTNRTLGKVPFDVEFWRGVAEREFPDGLPEPWSDDPTQWLFLGDPAVSSEPLQVGVARLLGYRWPDQEPDDLDRFADSDGIVCLPAVGGERAAADRLRELLVAAFEPERPTELVDGLLEGAEAGGKSLEWWLRERFFRQHCKLFHNRPFIWHIWDGRKDGFSALVNYHRLDRAGLEKLTYTYLGWWIDRQREQVRSEEAGAEARLGAALELQGKLELILEGEPPYDIYVRWKELWEQPVGWEPDLNDGVRLNIRPFVMAGVLRNKFNVHWKKDRGKNPDGSERLNDLHFTRQQKLKARKEHAGL